MSRHLASLAFAGWTAALGVTAAEAQQFSYVIKDYVHPDQPNASHSTGEIVPGTPRNWQSPTNYAEGTLYADVHVKSKPSETPTFFQICIGNGANYGCSDQWRFTKAGRYQWKTALPNFWQSGRIEWRSMTSRPSLIIKGEGNRAYDDPKDGRYYPLPMHVVLTVVAKGGALVRAGDAGAPDAGFDAGGTPDATTRETIAEGEDAAPAEKVDAHSADVTPVPTVRRDARDVDEMEASPSPSARPSRGGCAIGRAPPGPGGWTLMLVAAVGVRRLRPPRSRCRRPALTPRPES